MHVLLSDGFFLLIQVDFQVKICTANSYITGLSHQVRINFATILAVGCSTPWYDHQHQHQHLPPSLSLFLSYVDLLCRPKDSTVSNFLKALPPTCSLMVVDNGGRILLQCPGTSQQGSANKVLQSSQSALSRYSSYDQPQTGPQMQKSLSMPTTSTLSSLLQTEKTYQSSFKKTLQLPVSVSQKLFQRLATLEVKGSGTFFSSERLKRATNDFSPEFFIGEGGHSNVYQAVLENGQAVAVKVFKNTEESSEDELFREVEILSGLEHRNVIQLIGYCCGKEMYAIVYNLEKGSLKQKLKQLTWSERMRVAIGVAKALDYIHSCSPPIIHRDVKSSNILLSDNYEPQVSSILVC